MDIRETEDTFRAELKIRIKKNLEFYNCMKSVSSGEMRSKLSEELTELFVELNDFVAAFGLPKAKKEKIRKEVHAEIRKEMESKERQEDMS